MRSSHLFMSARRYINLPNVIVMVVLLSIASCRRPTVAQVTANTRLVELVPIDVDPKRVERRTFGSLTLLSAFQLASKDKRFGGLSGSRSMPSNRLSTVSTATRISVRARAEPRQA